MIVDDRTEQEHATHTVLVVGTDTFLSGWGKATGGRSIAAWACLPEHASKVFDWVESRSDMERVRTVERMPRIGKSDHGHIYVVNDTHPAVN